MISNVIDTISQVCDTLNNAANVAQESPNAQILDISNSLQIIAIYGILAAAAYGIIKGVFYIFYTTSHRKEKKRDEYIASFNTIIAQLSSDNHASQLSAAILLRRFLVDVSSNEKLHNLKTEAINEISSLLRILPTGIFQKTLGDGLAYARDLSGVDFQKTNMQDLLLDVKQGRISLVGADLFGADLSFANLNHVDARGGQFYGTILYNARIKNSDFTNANFHDADLYRVVFENTTLYNADFTNALNVPKEIKKHLKEGKYVDPNPVSNKLETNGKKVFFSMPGSMTKEDALITEEYNKALERLGYKVLCYTRDQYPKYGQLNKVCMGIESADAMIAFGFRQISIKNGVNRVNTVEEVNVSDIWMPTPWNEIEVGMGVMAGLPILLVKDCMINSGVFDSNLSECFIGTITTDADIRNLELNKEFAAWRNSFSE